LKLSLDNRIVKYYIGFRFNLNFIGFNLLNLGQLLVVLYVTPHQCRLRAMNSQNWSLVLYTQPEGLQETGPGISRRAAAARSQTVWRWLVKPQATSGKLDK